MDRKISLSIIIVNYKVKEELLRCIKSVIDSKPLAHYEIIVVENDVESDFTLELKKKFPQARYIKSDRNLGYGGGNNLGSKSAKGKYLFFLNPDTKILKGAINNLYNFVSTKRNVGIASPLFLDSNLNPFRSQGSEELKPTTLVFSQSFLRKIFPNKNIYNRDIRNNWDMKDPMMADVVPGAAMMINANLFRKIGGFEDKLFLYFEENDISKRMGNLGYSSFIVPSAKIIHLVGRSTKMLANVGDVYSKSRYYYLRKHYGILRALFAQAILSLNKNSILLLLILGIGLLLRVANLENTMPFIGDQGWFYLSARDMLVNGQIPLVGIASSHPWLHQGPLWTYMLALIFKIFGFNPVNGAYLTIVFGLITIYLIYLVGKKLFSYRIGLISGLLYATSPLAIAHSRTPYHTSPIPFFVLLFLFSLYRWIKGNNLFFPLSIFFLAILYNLELATSVLWFVFLAILLFGVWKRKEWAKNILNKRILFFSSISLLIPMLPILIYDFYNGFPQTLKFLIWIGYRVLRLFGFPSVGGASVASSDQIIPFTFSFYKELVFAPSSLIALILLMLSFLGLMLFSYRLYKDRGRNIAVVLLVLWVVIPLSGYFINKVPSEAYLPVLFPALILLLAHSLDKFIKVKFILLLIVLIIAVLNGYYAFLKDYSNKGITFTKRLVVSKEIVKLSERRPYNIIGRGDGSQFSSFTMNYQYLTWWSGHSPDKNPQKLMFIVNESADEVSLLQ